MVELNQAMKNVQEGKADERIMQVYGCRADETKGYAERMTRVLEGFKETFGEAQVAVFTAPGRTELGGNHTDHQKGCVLAGSVNLDVVACAAPNGTNVVRILSEGYPKNEVDVTDLEIREEEKNSTAALIRGVLSAAAQRGYKVGGFDAYMTSNVLGGSGLSSSAAYEVAVGTIVNHFFCGSELDAVEIAKIGQYAEREYFGKPCGLLDQMASSVGGIIAVDFADTGAPVVEQVQYSLADAGYGLCIVDTGGDHKELTGAYAAITEEMGAVARHFEKAVLNEVDEAAFMKAIPELRAAYGDRAVLRSMHYFAETKRAVAEKDALVRDDFDGFLELVKASGKSSAMYLQNVYAGISDRQQEIVLSLALAEYLLQGQGAVRVHGGGFAGTIQCFVPTGMVPEFKAGMEAVLGEGKCHVLTIRPEGGAILLK